MLKKMAENIGSNVGGHDRQHVISDEKQQNSYAHNNEEAPTRENMHLPTDKGISLTSYLWKELTRGYYLENDEAKFAEKRQRVYAFMNIPYELEKFMTYGFFQCVDAFLYMFTFLPIRFFMAMLKFFVKGCIQTVSTKPGRVLEPAEICDLLKGGILIACVFLMNYVDVSMMYHIIRGQAIIKLYIFFNMLEVADRLFSSFGQDILDSLFWTATEPRGRRREHVSMFPHLFTAIVIVLLHAILVLFQATTLNVAFNSHNKALLTIMMSNNFVELKGSVFKKFEKKNLFQMSCSDVRERFHFMILLSIVCMRNLTEFAWNMDHFWVLIPDMVMVMVAEVMVDWVKHAFITKFNEIPAEVYREYTVSLAYDMAAIRQKKAFSDHLDTVSRRMGLIPLPLAVLLIRIVHQSVKISTPYHWGLAVLFYLCLISFKVLNSILLLGMACDYIKENKEPASAKDKSSPATATKLTYDMATSPTKPTHKRQSSDNTVKTSSSSENNAGDKRDDKGAGNGQGDGDSDSVSPSGGHSCRRMNRSQSVGAKLNVTFSEAVCDLGPGADGYGELRAKRNGSFDEEEDNDEMRNSTPSGAMTPKALMSNSTVSLDSVAMNEEFIQDQAKSNLHKTVSESGHNIGNCSAGNSFEGGSDGNLLRLRKPDTLDITDKAKPKGEDCTKEPEKLHEVDRFSMCSNRII